MEVESKVGVSRIKNVGLYPMVHSRRQQRISSRIMAPIRLFLEGCLDCCVESRLEAARLNCKREFQGVHEKSPCTEVTGECQRVVSYFLFRAPAPTIQQSLGHRAGARGRVLTQTSGRSNDRNVSVLWI